MKKPSVILISSELANNFDAVANTVRYGEDPDSPELINRYIILANKIAADQPAIGQKLNVHYSVANTLLDSICDTYVDKFWRELCYANMHRVLVEIDQLTKVPARRTQLQQFRHELRISVNYFL